MPDWTPPFHLFEGASIRKVNGLYLLAYCRAVRKNQTARKGSARSAGLTAITPSGILPWAADGPTAVLWSTTEVRSWSTPIPVN